MVGFLTMTAAPPADVLRNAHSVTVYSASWCGPCRQAERYLNCISLPFEHREIDRDPAAERAFKALHGHSLPLMFVDGQRMDGYQEKTLIDLLGRGESEAARARLMGCLKR